MSKPYDGATVKTGETPLPSFGQAISGSLKGLQVSLGGKGLADYFDGRDGKEVAESTVSRWITEPTRFPATFLPVLVELDSNFRAQVFSLLAARMTAPAALLPRLSPRAAQEVQRVLASQVFTEIAPGRWGR